MVYVKLRWGGRLGLHIFDCCWRGKWTSLKDAGTGTGTGTGTETETETGTETRGLRVRMRSMKHALDLGCKHGWIRTRYDSHSRQ